MSKTSLGWLMGIAACLASGGCAARGQAPHEVVVRVESEPGQPLAGATLARGATILGKSDEQGIIGLALAGEAGEVVELVATCPSGYRTPDKPLSIALRTLAEQARKPEYSVVCAPLVRKLVIAVRAPNGPNLPLRYLGKELARTDAAGAAHALLSVSPGETVTVTLDTSADEHAALMPQHPELKLSMPEHDEVALFEQTFTRVETAGKKRVVARRGPMKL